MGCSLGKLLKRPPAEVTEQDIPDPPPPTAPDPRIPLTARQKFSIAKSWKGISRAMEPTGMNMFLKLFEDHSDLLSLFTKFTHLRTRDQQAESLELAEHANIVMNSIDEGITALDNVDLLFDLLHEIGGSHRKIPGFKKEYFWKIENPFLDAVKITLDDRYTENIENIYKITIKFLIETVIRGYELAEERELSHGGQRPLPQKCSTANASQNDACNEGMKKCLDATNQNISKNTNGNHNNNKDS